MAIVINGSGTVTGISVGGLPDDIVDSGTLASDALDSAVTINDSGADVDFRVESDTVTNALIVDGATGNVGIGVTPERDLHVKGKSGDPVHFKLEGDPADYARIMFDDGTTDNIGEVRYHFGDDYMGFSINSSECMRINQGSTYGKTMIEIGESFVGGDGVGYGVLSIVADIGDGQGGIGMKNANTHSAGGAHKFMDFQNSSAGNAGEISHTASTTVNYSTSSDYRLKENQVAISDGIDRVKQLKPYRFNWKAEPDRIVDGFFAHEVQGIVDEAITGTKDAMETRTNCVLNSDGTMIVSGVTEALWTEGKADETYPSDSTWEASKDFIKAQNIDQSKLVPLLTGALQEAVAKIEELTTRIETLENA